MKYKVTEIEFDFNFDARWNPPTKSEMDQAFYRAFHESWEAASREEVAETISSNTGWPVLSIKCKPINGRQ